LWWGETDFPHHPSPGKKTISPVNAEIRIHLFDDPARRYAECRSSWPRRWHEQRFPSLGHLPSAVGSAAGLGAFAFCPNASGNRGLSGGFLDLFLRYRFGFTQFVTPAGKAGIPVFIGMPTIFPFGFVLPILSCGSRAA
jgi:hypothetical protein